MYLSFLYWDLASNRLRQLLFQGFYEPFPVSRIGYLGNHVADEQGVGQKARHDLDVQPVVAGEVVEENIVAVVVTDEFEHKVVCRALHIADKLRERSLVAEDEVDFIETDDGPQGQVDFDAFFTEDRRAGKMAGLNVVVVVVVFEADDLRVGMVNRPARHVAVVAVEYDGAAAEAFHGLDLPPFFQSEADEVDGVGGVVGGKVAVAVVCFDNQGLPGVLQDGVGVFQPNHMASGVHDVLQMGYVAEGAVRFVAVDRIGLRFPYV